MKNMSQSLDLAAAGTIGPPILLTMGGYILTLGGNHLTL